MQMKSAVDLFWYGVVLRHAKQFFLVHIVLDLFGFNLANSLWIFLILLWYFNGLLWNFILLKVHYFNYFNRILEL